MRQHCGIIQLSMSDWLRAQWSIHLHRYFIKVYVLLKVIKEFAIFTFSRWAKSVHFAPLACCCLLVPYRFLTSPLYCLLFPRVVASLAWHRLTGRWICDVAICLSGNIVGLINEVTLRRAGLVSINQSKFICRNNNDINIYMAIINSGRLPEKPNGSMNWLPNTK